MSTSGCGLVHTTPNPDGERVLVRVADDESAIRITAVLGSLGFDVVRDCSECSGNLFEFVAFAFARRYRLTLREQQVTLELLRGESTDSIAHRLRLSKGTIKWNLYNIYAKAQVDSRELLLRLALRLDDPRWLSDPLLRQRTVERFEAATHEALAALRRDPPDLAVALSVLEAGLAEGD